MSITHNEYEMIKKMIGDFLQQRREEVGLTQAGVAESAGIRESTVQRIESGKFIPGGKTLLRLCEALSLQLIFQASSKPNLKKEMQAGWVQRGQFTGTIDNPGTLDDSQLEKLIAQLGNYFFERRKKLRLTPEMLSEIARLGIPSIQRIETGQHFPDGKTIVKLCYGLDSVFYPMERPADGSLVTFG